ncbi:MAG: tRNA (guanosine(37)-N1)-methyltransferase TrmD [Saprospiraceae bacterium]
MRIDIIAVIPGLLSGPLNHSILQRAKDKGLLEVHVHDLRKFGIGPYNQIDDYQFGGGAGMVLMMEPLVQCLEILRSEHKYDEIIYMSPDGETFDQRLANQLSLLGNFMIVCGHYKGVDQRFRDHYITREISVGDFVLSGGELAAAIIVDAVGRLLPGVLSDETSALFDSFQDDLLAPPVYTRPAVYKDWEVPAILLSGHEEKISEWRFEQSLERTKLRRPDLIEKYEKGN